MLDLEVVAADGEDEAVARSRQGVADVAPEEAGGAEYRDGDAGGLLVVVGLVFCLEGGERRGRSRRKKERRRSRVKVEFFRRSTELLSLSFFLCFLFLFLLHPKRLTLERPPEPPRSPRLERRAE